jgi:hypothetical protein
MKRYTPDELLSKYRSIRDEITTEEFFRSPKHKKTQEMWCAAHFARAYNQHVAPCTVLISDEDEQTDADFFLETGGKSYPFQVTELMEPGRRRGDEYRAGGSEKTQDEDWSEGTEHGPVWVRSAIERKLKKKYAGTLDLNLLLYLNFAAYEQQYEDTQRVRSGRATIRFGVAVQWQCTVLYSPELSDGSISGMDDDPGITGTSRALTRACRRPPTAAPDARR